MNLKMVKVCDNCCYTVDGAELVLYSYCTAVARYNTFSGKFERMFWGDKADSQTTMKHINKFREKFGLGKITKQAWNAILEHQDRGDGNHAPHDDAFKKGAV